MEFNNVQKYTLLNSIKYILFLLYFLWRYNENERNIYKKSRKIKTGVINNENVKYKAQLSELARIYKMDRRTITKYNNGYCRENIKNNKKIKIR